MEFRSNKTSTLIGSQCMECIQMAYDHSNVDPVTRDRLYFLAKSSMTRLVEQLCGGVISSKEFVDMERDINDMFCVLLAGEF